MLIAAYVLNKMERLTCVSVLVFFASIATRDHGRCNALSASPNLWKDSFSGSPCHDLECPKEDAYICAFLPRHKTYKVFAGRCAMLKHATCKFEEPTETEMLYCIRHESRRRRQMRRMYGEGESCPVFCPQHYRPVCGASKIRDYVYRTFTNSCHLDMLNCRGDDEVSGYVEVPLSFCQKHYMKNIFKDQIVASHLPDYRDYDH